MFYIARSFLIAFALAILALGPLPAAAFSDSNTSRVVTQLDRGVAQCADLPAAYHYDCLRQVYKKASGEVARLPDYRPASTAMKKVEKTLRKIVRENEDKSADNLRVGGKTYKPVKPETVRASRAIVERAIQEARTELLRASNNRQNLHFVKIAEALDSTKVLLRS